MCDLKLPPPLPWKIQIYLKKILDPRMTWQLLLGFRHWRGLRFFFQRGGVCLYIWDMSRYSDQLSISEYAYCIKLLTVKSWRVSRIPLPWSAQTKLIYIQTYNYEYITTLSIFISRYRTFHLILLLSVKVQFLNTIHVPSIF